MVSNIVLRKFMIPDLAGPLRESARGACDASGELVPFDPARVSASPVLGRRITDLSTNVGTYGMGGPGFFGLHLETEWLVVAIWGAASWIHCEGRSVEDRLFEERHRPKPWITRDKDELTPRVVGSEIDAFRISAHSLCIGLTSGLELMIEESPLNRPVHEGSQQPRAFSAQDDLRDGVFLSPTAEIWM